MYESAAETIFQQKADRAPLLSEKPQRQAYSLQHEVNDRRHLIRYRNTAIEALKLFAALADACR